MNGWIIFILLITLMLTGMPISIALGLTVLSFLFLMTDLPAELVSQRLFTGLDQFAIMAIPFFILAGTFLTHGGVARRMIRFATALVGHFHGGLAMAESTRYVWDIAKKENDDAIAKIKAAKTTEIYVLPASEKAVWRKAMLPLYQEYEGVVGKDTLQEIEKTVAQSAKK